jgi:hypothetical protein
MINKRLLKILVLLLVVFVAVVLVYGHVNKKENRTFHRLTTNLQHFWLHGSDVYFYSGSFFAKYNLQTNQVVRLSDYLDIQGGISSVDWGTDAVVFQTNPSANNRDDVTTAASQLGLQPYEPHWWRYSFNDTQYQLLNFSGINDCSSLIQINHSLLACAKPQSSGSQSYQLNLFDVSSLTSKKLANSDDTIGGLATDGKNIFYTVTRLSGKQTLNEVNLSSQKVSELYRGDGTITYRAYTNDTLLINDVPVSNPGQTDSHADETPLIASSQKLVSLNNGGVVFTKNFRSLPISFYEDGGRAHISSLDGSIKYVEGNNLKQQFGTAAQPLKQGSFLFSYGGSLYMIGVDGILSSWPKLNNSHKDSSEFNISQDNDPTGNSWIDNESGGVRDAYLFRNDVSSSQQEQQVGANLEARGFWASEFNFNWVVDGADYHTPVAPKAIIIQ